MTRPRRRRRSRLACLALAAAATFAGAVAPAAALEVDRAELRDLARRAARDPAALERLREVDRVDGRRVDLRRALGAAEGRQLERRLDALAGGAPERPPAAADARRRAERILAEPRFRRSSLPQPLREPLERIGKAIADLFGWVPSGSPWFWIGLSAALIGLALLLTRRMAGRRSAAVAAGRRAGGRLDPLAEARRLEQAADEAERAGEAREAIRLRFRAGVLRLDAERGVRGAATLPNAAIARRLGSDDFRELAARFDTVVYGGRPADAADAAAARERWARVLDEVAA